MRKPNLKRDQTLNGHQTWPRLLAYLTGNAQRHSPDNTDEALHDFPPPSHIARMQTQGLGLSGARQTNSFPQTGDIRTYMPIAAPVHLTTVNFAPRTHDDGFQIPSSYIGNQV